MRRETQNVLLLLLGGALLKISITGAYLRYVRPIHLPWLIAASVVMLLLAVAAIVRDFTGHRDPAAPDSCGPAGCGDHQPHRSRSPWLLMLPVLAIFIIAPPSLGADAVNRASSRTATAQQPRTASWFAPLPAGDVIPLRLAEFVTRARLEPQPLQHRTVQLTGFVVHDQAGTRLARVTISCCAADATPFTVRLADADRQLATLPNDTWVTLTGQLVPGTATEATNLEPALATRSIHTIPAPSQPYDNR